MPFLRTKSAVSVKSFGFKNRKGGGSGSTSPPPVSGYTLWYDGNDLSTYSTGSDVTSWTNKGSKGTSFNLINTNGLANNTAGTVPPKKATNGGKHGIEFDGSANRVLWFKGWHDSQSSTTGVFYFDGANGGGSTVNPVTLFYVYFITGTANTISAFGCYAAGSPGGLGGNYANAGFAYNGNYVIIESNDGFPIGSATGVVPTANAISQAGHSQSTGGGQVIIWVNKSGSTTNLTYSDAASASVAPAGIGYGRSSTKNNGIIFEIVAYESTLNNTQINSVREWLGSKYGTS